MNKKYFFSLALSALVLISSFGSVYADKKKFARSYSAATLPAGALEMELWQTGKFEKDAGYFYRWQPRFELEYGITDRLSSSLYFNFDQTKTYDNNYSNEPLTLSSTSMEFRYRLTNPGDYFLDPALYFEIGYGGDAAAAEPKLIFSKQLGNFSGVLNFAAEFEKNFPEKEMETTFEISMGLMYDLNQNISAGVELIHERVFKNVFETEENSALYLGPTISVQLNRVYFVVNFLTQLSGSPSTLNGLDLIGHERYQIRSILGIEL